MADTLTVQIVTPDREVAVADDATLVIAKGLEGDMGIMAHHAPVLIALGSGPLTVVRGDRRDVMAVDGGFLQMNHNQVIVLAEFVALPGEIDIESVRAGIAELERVAGAEGDEGAAARTRLARAKAMETVHALART